MPHVTYTGRAGQYYVTDKDGKRHNFPRGVRVEVTDAVAALVPKKNKDLTVTKTGATGDRTADASASEERK